MRTLILVLLLVPACARADTSYTFYSVTCVPALSSAHVDTFQIADADDYVFPPSRASAAAQFKIHEENMRRLAADGVYAYGPDDGAIYLAEAVECVTPNFTLRVITKPIEGTFLNDAIVMYGDRPTIEIAVKGRVVFRETLDETESVFADGHFAPIVALTRCVDHRSSFSMTYDRVCRQFGARP